MANNTLQETPVSYLSEKRKELRMTQDEFAELLGLSGDVYRKYEEGNRNLPNDKFHMIKNIIMWYEKSEYITEPKNIRDFLEISRKECLTRIFCEKQHDIVNIVFDFLIRKAK